MQNSKTHGQAPRFGGSKQALKYSTSSVNGALIPVGFVRISWRFTTSLNSTSDPKSKRSSHGLCGVCPSSLPEKITVVFRHGSYFLMPQMISGDLKMCHMQCGCDAQCEMTMQSMIFGISIFCFSFFHFYPYKDLFGVKLLSSITHQSIKLKTYLLIWKDVKMSMFQNMVIILHSRKIK